MQNPAGSARKPQIYRIKPPDKNLLCVAFAVFDNNHIGEYLTMPKKM